MPEHFNNNNLNNQEHDFSLWLSTNLKHNRPYASDVFTQKMSNEFEQIRAKQILARIELQNRIWIACGLIVVLGAFSLLMWKSFTQKMLAVTTELTHMINSLANLSQLLNLQNVTIASLIVLGICVSVIIIAEKNQKSTLVP